MFPHFCFLSLFLYLTLSFLCDCYLQFLCLQCSQLSFSQPIPLCIYGCTIRQYFKYHTHCTHPPWSSFPLNRVHIYMHVTVKLPSLDSVTNTDLVAFHNTKFSIRIYKNITGRQAHFFHHHWAPSLSERRQPQRFLSQQELFPGGPGKE